VRRRAWHQSGAGPRRSLPLTARLRTLTGRAARRRRARLCVGGVCDFLAAQAHYEQRDDFCDHLFIRSALETWWSEHRDEVSGVRQVIGRSASADRSSSTMSISAEVRGRSGLGAGQATGLPWSETSRQARCRSSGATARWRSPGCRRPNVRSPPHPQCPSDPPAMERPAKEANENCRSCRHERASSADRHPVAVRGISERADQLTQCSAQGEQGYG